MTLDVALRHRFGRFTLDAAFAAPVPGVTVLFGPSGSGKSTVLQAVAGLLRPEAGRVAVDGAVLLDTARGVDVDAARRGCGVVFQDARLFPHLSVRSNLLYGARRAAKDAAGPEFGEVVELLGITPLLDRRPRRLSGGERQRVALGRALLSRPRLLLMDEPLAALDAPRRADVLPFLQRLRAHAAVPILYVTHDLGEADRLADTMVLMEEGRVLAHGPLDALCARTDLPLLQGRRDAGVVLSCTVAGHDAVRGLTRLEFPGGALLTPLRGDTVGGLVRIRVRSRDVAVALLPPAAISSHNVLPVAVAAISPAGAHEAVLTLHAGPTVLLARVTRDAVDRLALAPGMQVHALVKAAAFDGGEA